MGVEWGEGTFQIRFPDFSNRFNSRIVLKGKPEGRHIFRI